MAPSAPVATALPLHEAAALGAIQGATEILPVSSSGHLVLLPQLWGWRYPLLEPEVRKSFEVALHGATAAALLWLLREEVVDELRGMTRGELGWHVLAGAPAALAGLALERPIESRLGSVPVVAIAQIGGGIALLVADRRPAARRSGDARSSDALLIGLAQALALVPGVSRTGAVLTVARLRAFERAASWRLSRRSALPVIFGAAALRGLRHVRGGTRPRAAPLAVGMAAAGAGALAAGPLVRRLDRSSSYLAVSGYRVALGLVVLRRSAAGGFG